MHNVKAIKGSCLAGALIVLSGILNSARADVVINEFSASGTALLDDQNERSDWIELHNTSKQPVSLERWFLTDDPDHWKGWTFPKLTIAPNGFLVVFASGKNQTDVSSLLHSSFRLERTNGYLALLLPDKKGVVSEITDYPKQHAGYSFGLIRGSDSDSKWGYFVRGTPGAANSGKAFAGVLGKPKMSVKRGFFDKPFSLEMGLGSDAAQIRYTTDGSFPTMRNGRLYQGAITINSTKIIRAIASQEGWANSEVATHTYVFPSEVLKQDGKGLPRACPTGPPPCHRSAKQRY